MNSRDAQIFKQLAQNIRMQFPSAEIRMFGSRARGNAAPDADMDVCVILDTINRNIRNIISHIVWEVGFDNDTVVTALTYSRDEVERGPRSASTLIKTIFSEGIAA